HDPAREACRELRCMVEAINAGAGAIIALAIAVACAGPLSAKEHRSREVTREFQREHPCPSTGLTSGACPGYRQGSRLAARLRRPRRSFQHQWQTVAAAKAKYRWEVRACGR